VEVPRAPARGTVASWVRGVVRGRAHGGRAPGYPSGNPGGFIEGRDVWAVALTALVWVSSTLVVCSVFKSTRDWLRAGAPTDPFDFELS
jgi:hypothetical protein